MGTASLRIFSYVFCLGLRVRCSFFDSVQTGYSIQNGQTFEEFLGLMFEVIKDKYWEWLRTAYSTCSSTLGLKRINRVL